MRNHSADDHYGVIRSARWQDVARAHLAKHPACAACAHPGATNAVHHIFPVHFCIALGRADLELDERNLITLCGESDARGAGNHHLLLGHLDDYESMNLAVRHHALDTFHGFSAIKLRDSAGWQILVAKRSRPLVEMTHAERRAVRALMDTRIPPPRS